MFYDIIFQQVLATIPSNLPSIENNQFITFEMMRPFYDLLISMINMINLGLYHGLF